MKVIDAVRVQWYILSLPLSCFSLPVCSKHGNRPPPNPKRQKTDTAEVKTSLFFIARYPWKATVLLPSMQSFTPNEVRNVLKKSNIAAPNFPKGEFQVVRAELDYRVAIFKYSPDGVAGCGTTSSKHHKALPLPIKVLKNMEDFTREPNQLQLGYKFLWGGESTIRGS